MSPCQSVVEAARSHTQFWKNTPALPLQQTPCLPQSRAGMCSRSRLNTSYLVEEAFLSGEATHENDTYHFLAVVEEPCKKPALARPKTCSGFIYRV